MDKHEWVELPVEDGTRMRAWTAVPEGGWRRGLLLFQEAFGVNPHIRDVAMRFSRQGYSVIAPELYHRTAPGFEAGYDNFDAVQKHFKALTPEGLGADINAAHAWLAAHHGMTSNIAAVGFCMGGRVAYLANSLFPLRAAISFYGGGIPPLLDRASSLTGPMLFFWGERDAHIPAEQRRAITEAMLAAKKPFTMTEFSDAGHGFFCDARPSFHAASARQARAIMQAFLEECFNS